MVMSGRVPTSSSRQRFSLMAPQQPRKPRIMMMTPMAIIRSTPGIASLVSCDRQGERVGQVTSGGRWEGLGRLSQLLTWLSFLLTFR